jgi:hypothetical protein
MADNEETCAAEAGELQESSRRLTVDDFFARVDAGLGCYSHCSVERLTGGERFPLQMAA